MSPSKLQLTLALLKPDISLNERAVSEIIRMMAEKNYVFVKSKMIKLSIDQAKDFYKVHESNLWIMKS